MTPQIRELVIEICKRLGLDPDNVARLELQPRQVTATVFVLNGNGKKHLGADGEPVIETVRIEVE